MTKDLDNAIPQIVRDIIINLFNPNIPPHVRDNHRDTLEKIANVSRDAIIKYEGKRSQVRNKAPAV